jgi:hypothetical protein
MKKVGLLFVPILACLTTVGSSAAAEPGQNLPATITGAGVINGTDGDDVIVGSAEQRYARRLWSGPDGATG